MKQTKQDIRTNNQSELDFFEDDNFSYSAEDEKYLDEMIHVETPKKAHDLHKIRRSIEDHLERKRMKQYQEFPDIDDFDTY